MKKLLKRPLALSCGVFLILLFLQIGFNLSAAARIAITAAGVFLLALFLLLFIIEKTGKKEKKKSFYILLFCIPVLLSSLLSHTAYYSKVASAEKYLGAENEFNVKTERVVYSSAYSAEYEVRIDEISGDKVSYKASLPGCEPGCEEGDVLRFTGVLSLPEDEDRGYNISRGRLFTITGAEDFTLVSTDNEISLRGKLEGLNGKLESILERYLGKDSSVPSAMFLGNRSALSQDVKRDFKELGIYHLLALSGLHLALLTGALGVLLTPIIGRKKTYIFQIVFTVFYMLICGMPPSIVRAGIMLIILLLSFFLRRGSDSVTTLFLSVTLICIADPLSAADAGLMLSFAATLGIIVLSPRASALAERICPSENRGRIKKFLNSLLNGFFVSLSAIIFTLPLIFAYYGEFPLFSALFTFIASPFVTLILLLTLLLLVFSFIPFIAGLIASALSFVCRALLFITGSAARFTDLTISLNYPFTGIIIALVSAALILLVLLNKNTLKRGALIILAGAAAFTVCYTVHWIRMPDIAYTLFNEKQNDAALIVSGRKASILDSSAEYYAFLNNAVSKTNEEYRLDEIENLIFTHYHKNLPNTVLRLSEKYYIKNIYIPLPETDSDREIYNLIKEEDGIQSAVTEYKPGEELTTGNLKFVIDRAETPASSHPVYSALVSSGGEKDIIYISSGYPDYSEIKTEENKKYDLLVGTHGPKYKQVAELEKYKNIENITFASDEDREYIK